MLRTVFSSSVFKGMCNRGVAETDMPRCGDIVQVASLHSDQRWTFSHSYNFESFYQHYKIYVPEAVFLCVET